MKHILAFSGGKDSTACGFLLAKQGVRFEALFTPTGNELPEVRAHVEAMVARWGAPLIIPKGPTLLELIQGFQALPNWRQRWCTRMIKIVPCIAYLQTNPGSTLYVGLRADEEAREGLYGNYATYRYPLREAEMGVAETLALVEAEGVCIPKRTDCALCYGQRLTEWHALWENEPEEYAKGEQLETITGHTFRSPGRDTWPASLVELRREFEKGRQPRGQEAYDKAREACRVCRL
jgi:PP-loop superfamily ATP-utilizing enzyme